MSRALLDAFKNDIQSINPDYRESTSSLRNLIRFLSGNVGAPTRLSLDEAVAKCGNANDKRIAKYRPAIERLVSVWGVTPPRPYPRLTPGHSLQTIDINRICFRGDSRPPAQVFAEGFSRRNADGGVEYRGGEIGKVSSRDPYRHPLKGTLKAGDITPATAVCVTPDMHVAALFPLPEPDMYGKETWIYMLLLTSGVNTNSRQVLDALYGLAQLEEFEKKESWDPAKAGGTSALEAHGIRVSEIVQNLYGRELATESVAGPSIWYAFKISRTWNEAKTWVSPDGVPRGKGNYHKGGSYSVVEIHPNPNKQFPNDEYRTAVGRFVSALSRNAGPFTMPTHDSGFHASNVKELS